MKVIAWKSMEGITPNMEINITGEYKINVEFNDGKIITLRFHEKPFNGRIHMETQDGCLRLEPECLNCWNIGVEP